MIFELQTNYPRRIFRKCNINHIRFDAICPKIGIRKLVYMTRNKKVGSNKKIGLHDQKILTKLTFNFKI